MLGVLPPSRAQVMACRIEDDEETPSGSPGDAFDRTRALGGHHAVAESEQGVHWIAGWPSGPLGEPHGGTGKNLLHRPEINAGSIAFNSSNMVGCRCVAYSRHVIEYLSCPIGQGIQALPASSVTSPSTDDMPAVLQLRSHDGLGQSKRVGLVGYRLVLRQPQMNIAACLRANDEPDRSARGQG